MKIMSVLDMQNDCTRRLQPQPRYAARAIVQFTPALEMSNMACSNIQKLGRNCMPFSRYQLFPSPTNHGENGTDSFPWSETCGYIVWKQRPSASAGRNQLTLSLLGMDSLVRRTVAVIPYLWRLALAGPKPEGKRIASARKDETGRRFWIL